MRRTVLIIAHNEEDHIHECLSSVMSQAVIPDEVLLVAHNCTDNTVALARNFSCVRIEELRTREVWPVFPRIRGFDLASFDIIACLDGDAVADPNWLGRLTEPFLDERISGTGGDVRFFRDWSGNIAALGFFRLSQYFHGYHFYFWGANFACRKSAYKSCGWLFPLLTLRNRLDLAYWADDCYLSLALEQQWRVRFVWGAKVWVYPKSTPSINIFSRWKGQASDRWKLFAYFGIR